MGVKVLLLDTEKLAKEGADWAQRVQETPRLEATEVLVLVGGTGSVLAVLAGLALMAARLLGFSPPGENLLHRRRVRRAVEELEGLRERTGLAWPEVTVTEEGRRWVERHGYEVRLEAGAVQGFAALKEEEERRGV